MSAQVERAGKRGGRVKGTPNRITRDIRDCIEQAFHKAGGRDYLVRVAKRRPDVFLALVGKILPAEMKVSLLAQYQALPSVPVEIRDAIPGQVISSPEPAAAVITQVLQAEPDDDWLALPAPELPSIPDHVSRVTDDEL